MPTRFDPVATFNAEIARIVGERDPRKHRVAIRNVERMIATLRFAPRGLHVTHLIDGKARLEAALAALEQKVAA